MKKNDARGIEPGAYMVKCNCQGTFTMNYFTTKQGVLFYDYTIEVEQTSKIDRFLELLESSGVAELLAKESSNQLSGRPEIDPFRLFACILYGFAMGSSSLRELETSCRYDTRFMYIMDQVSPSHISFGRYINKVVKPNQERIFSGVTKAILRHFNLEIDDCFIDGTKIEADANRYKFVWRPTKFHESLNEKTRNLLALMGLDRGIPAKGLIPSSLIAERVTRAKEALGTLGGPQKKAYSGMLDNLISYLEKTMEYEEKERVCGPGRNSYYKTDHDATAMCLKRDYYSGLGSNMHPAYQVQLCVTSGLIASYYVSQDRTDIYTFIPAIEELHDMYGTYPMRIGADSGYGSLDNYQYCRDRGIKAFIKYQSWEGECSGRRPAVYELNDDGTITCLGGRIGKVTAETERHHRFKGSVFYKVDNCTGCEFMPYCRQFMKEATGTFKIFEVNPAFQRLKQEARDLLLSPEGIEMRVNRSCQVEGCFGVLKQDMSFDRFRRVGMDQVKVELMLNALGYNIRKFLRYCERGVPARYWTAPEGTGPEKFKKPSAKRLKNRIEKKRSKSANEIAREYKYR